MATTNDRLYPKPDPVAITPETVEDAFNILRQALDMVDNDVVALLSSVSGKAAAAHGHAIADISGLAAAIAAKMDASATFDLDWLNNVYSTAGASDGYVLVKTPTGWTAASAASVIGAHSHAMGDIVGLSAALLTKADATALAAEAALARNASSLNDGTVPDAQLLYSSAVPYALAVDATTNINTLTSPGMQKGLYGTGNANLPTPGYYYIWNFQYSSATHVAQFAMPYTDEGMYRRYLYGSTWSAWKLIPTQAENDTRYAQLTAPNSFTGVTYFAADVNFLYQAAWGGSAVLFRNAASNYRSVIRHMDATDRLRLEHYFAPANSELSVGVDGIWKVGTNPVHHDGNASRYGAPDAVLEDQKAQNTAPQTVTSGAWTTRHLNTEVHDPSGLVTLSGNQFTVTTDGWVEWETTGTATGKTRLWNVTDGVVAGVGENYFASGSYVKNGGGAAVVAGKTYRLEQNQNTTGVGVLTNLATEVYTRVLYWRR